MDVALPCSRAAPAEADAALGFPAWETFSTACPPKLWRACQNRSDGLWLAYPNPNGRAIAKRCEGLLLAARGELARAIDAMEAALAHHSQRLLPLELGRTLLEKGSLERRAKRKTAAKQTLEQAVAVLEPLGAAIWVARARDELSRIGLRRAVVSDGLTPAQSRVAELAVAGATNREIAQTLYMSERSVEAHLTKIYREFGIRSRAQLAGALGGTAGTSS